MPIKLLSNASFKLARFSVSLYSLLDQLSAENAKLELRLMMRIRGLIEITSNHYKTKPKLQDLETDFDPSGVVFKAERRKKNR